VLTISSSQANAISDEVKAQVELLANVIGYMFSMYAVSHRPQLQKEGEKALKISRYTRGFNNMHDTEAARQFALEISGLRRLIADYFENIMLAEKKHVLVDQHLHCAKQTDK
jgi:hypothetical protein